MKSNQYYAGIVMDNVSNNIQYYLKLRNMSQRDLAREANISQQSISKYITKKSIPRPDVVKQIADAFGCSYDNIVGNVDKSEEESTEYYYSNKTEQMAQQLFENRELRMLFDAAKDVDAETIQKLHEILLLMKKK